MTLERLTQITSVGISSGITLSSATLTGVTTLTTASASGNISAVDGTFSGNLNVAGTLTYEDVSNIDSVGIVTARSGLNVTGGNVGIGTDSAGTDLHLVTYGGHGKIRVESSGDGNRAGIEFFRESNAGTGKGAAGIWVESETGNSSGELRFGTANNASLQSFTTKMILDSTGNLGIGTETPDTSLRVVESYLGSNVAAQSNDIAVFERNDNGYIKVLSPNDKVGGVAFGDTNDSFIGAVRYDHDDNNLNFYVNNAERLRINSSGNVGIGSETPRYGLDVYTNNLLVSGSSAGNLILEDRGVADGSRPFALLASNDGNFTITNANRNASGTTTSSVERLRIDSNGVVTIPGQPIMEVYAVTSGSTSVSGNSATTLIPFNAANTYDPGNDMNVSTGVYTVPADGRYLLHYGTEGKTAANSNAGSIYYNLNGGGINGQCLYYGEAYSGNSKQVILNLSAGDEIIWQIYGNNNQSYSINAANYGIQMIG